MALNISVFLFAVAMLTSKSLITLMTVILILWSLIAKSQRQLWLKNNKAVLIVALFPLALIVSLFSLGGWQSALTVVKSWPWPLLAAPAVCIYHNKILTDFFKKGLLLGLVLAVGCSLVKLVLALNSEITAPFMSDNFRIASFWDISRWGFFSGIAVLILFFTWHQLSLRKHKMLFGALLIFTAISFALTNTRATAVAALAGLIFFAATDRRMIKTLLVGIAAASVFIFLTPKFQQRVQSIFAVNITDGKNQFRTCVQCGTLYHVESGA